MSEQRRRLTEQAAQARRDLEGLAFQVEAGEIDEETAAPLRANYLRELEMSQTELDDLPVEEAVIAPRSRSRSRLVVGAAILMAGVALTIGVVGSFAQERDADTLEGVAAGPGGGIDLDTVSNETMEAVIESYRNDPSVADQLPLMEFRLAERYFEDQDYLASFPHYSNVIQHPSAPPDRIQASLTRVGWMVWLLNGETDLALSTLDQALVIDPANPETLYVKGQVLWCGAGRATEAVPLFQQVLDSNVLDPQVVDQVSTDLELAASGQDCTS
jgi:cytochrome c-type biogenesis protein CcmH/NrfG